MRPGVLWMGCWLMWACQPEPAWTADTLPPPPAPLAPCTPASAPAGRCAERCGSYVTSFEQVEGDCGKRPEQLAHLSGDPSVAPAPCRGSFSRTSDNCITQFDIHCPMKDASGTTLASIERGSLRWASDASSAGGNLELWLTGADSVVRCHSQYVVSIQRQ